LSSKNRTWRNEFYKCPKKKLYRQEVPGRHLGIQKSSGTSFWRVSAQLKHCMPLNRFRNSRGQITHANSHIFGNKNCNLKAQLNPDPYF